MENEIRTLVDKLNYYTKLYDEGHPAISDKEWDDMYFKLQNLETLYNIYLSDSPTQNINYQVVNKLNKVKHNHPMLSLDKTKSIDAIKSFLGNKDFICMAKMDGLTCSLRYLDGKLVSAETRGNGIEGEDILHNALQVKNIPNKINYKEELIIDGEIICTYNDFKDFEKEYKNPRNFASGSIRLLDSKESSMRKLTFVVWDIIKGLDEEKLLTGYDRLSNKLSKAETLGFTIVPFEINLPEYETIEQIMEIVKKSSSIYPIDGLVFKYDNCDEYIAAGKTDHHFKGGLAYKFYDEEYETILQNIEWTMGRTGVLTPVAIFEPIDIDGTEVSRANLHNISVIRDLFNETPKKGQKIYIYKANQIIPQISKVEKYEETGEDSLDYLNPPNECPICGHETELFGDNDSIFLQCGNPACEGKLLNRVEHFFSKKGLNAKGLSKATIEKLIDWGWINGIKDVFILDAYAEDWKKKAGFGEKSVNNIITSIKESSNTDLESVISAAGIPLIGRTVARQITSIFNTYEDFREAIGNFDFSEIDGFGYEMNKSLKNYNYDELDYIVENFLTINNKIEERKEQKLEGLTFCVTGKIKQWKNRDELSSFITSLGGKVVGSVSTNMDYLINNDINSTSSKNLRAKELGKQIIDEQTFMDMFDL
jgi:DNA ligase (NAD+)